MKFNWICLGTAYKGKHMKISIPVLVRAPIVECISPLKQRWKLFFESLGVSVKTVDSPLSTNAQPNSSHLWLVEQQTHVHIKQNACNNVRQELKDQNLCRTFAQDDGYPLLYIVGEPQPYDYSVVLFPPRYNSRLYPKFSNARFGVAPDQELSLWLIQDYRKFKVRKLWNLRQAKQKRTALDNIWLMQAFANVRNLGEPITIH
jgi:hypothetical protein